ncbi:MAG: precorrin-6A/cobalt-precorrin-6A reductase [Holophaga sp.]|nr:precorrin-6A/cobalt-precorrin-6A reductase [Holophaga sp.]
MILLLGGTSETAPLARALLDQGLDLLVCTATDAPLELPPGLVRRSGRMDAGAIAGLCAAVGARALVDAGHPFASGLHAACRLAANGTGLPLLRWLRAPSELPPGTLSASGHPDAARKAFGLGGPVLVTSGSRNLAPYVAEARRTGLPLLVRVLDHPESLAACRAAGLELPEIVTGRGPFTLQANRELLRRHGARALVTKDSGAAGGLGAKLDAARLEGCAVVVVARPETDPGGFTDPRQLALAAAACCP